ncbi:MAG: hypothetical protein PHW53_03325 [Patescibacteria group bacterium]|nr:hypothetical protein [Patescibacteria group bacterium]
MTLRAFILFMLLATIICWSAFLIIIFKTNPYETGALGFIFFYASLFLSLIGTLTVAGIFVRMIILKRDDFISRRVAASFRQGAFLAAVAVAGLYLMSRGLLTWWNVLFFVAGVSLLEFFFISIKRLK